MFSFFIFLMTRLFEVLASDQELITDIRVFDNLTQTDWNSCTDKGCPGVTVSTPTGCVCLCGDGLTLNAGGSKCIPQLPPKLNDCPNGMF